MISSKDMEFFRRIKPRTGFYVRRWGPVFARRVDRLFDAGLIHWSTSSDKPGMNFELTRKGETVWRKL